MCYEEELTNGSDWSSEWVASSAIYLLLSYLKVRIFCFCARQLGALVNVPDQDPEALCFGMCIYLYTLPCRR